MTSVKTISNFSSARRDWPPERRGLLSNFSARILLFLIQLYRHTLSPAQVFLFGAGSGCRFTPTCSQYAIEAIRERGAATGSLLALKRICRCHPFGGCGHDPVPRGSGSFGFWLRFRSVTGRVGHAPSLKPRQNAKIPRCRMATLFLKTR